MPEAVGNMHKGTPITRGPVQPIEAGTPTNTPRTGPAPRGEQHDQEAHKTVGRNDRRAH